MVGAAGVLDASGVVLTGVVGSSLDRPDPELPDVHEASVTTATATEQTRRSEPTRRASHIVRRGRQQCG